MPVSVPVTPRLPKIDAAIPKLEELRRILQELVDRFPVVEEPASWVEGAAESAASDVKVEIDDAVRARISSQEAAPPYGTAKKSEMEFRRDETRKANDAKRREHLAALYSLREVLPPVVNSFKACLAESRSREGSIPPVLESELIGELANFSALTEMHVGQPFMLPPQLNRDTYVVPGRSDGSLSPAALEVWIECLELFQKAAVRLRKSGLEEQVRELVAKRAWGETRYPNLLDTESVNQVLKKTRARFNDMLRKFPREKSP